MAHLPLRSLSDQAAFVSGSQCAWDRTLQVASTLPLTLQHVRVQRLEPQATLLTSQGRVGRPPTQEEQMKNDIPTIEELLRLPKGELQAMFRKATSLASDQTRPSTEREAAAKTVANIRRCQPRFPGP